MRIREPEYQLAQRLAGFVGCSLQEAVELSIRIVGDIGDGSEGDVIHRSLHALVLEARATRAAQTTVAVRLRPERPLSEVNADQEAERRDRAKTRKKVAKAAAAPTRKALSHQPFKALLEGD